jgi:hypothetical protein
MGRVLIPLFGMFSLFAAAASPGPKSFYDTIIIFTDESAQQLLLFFSAWALFTSLGVESLFHTIDRSHSHNSSES